MNEAVSHVDSRLEPFKPDFFREVKREDIIRLWEIKMGRILKFNVDKANDHIANLQKDIERLQFDLDNITDYTSAWYSHLKEKYGEAFPDAPPYEVSTPSRLLKWRRPTNAFILTRQEDLLARRLKTMIFYSLALTLTTY